MIKEDAFNKLEKMGNALEVETRKFIDFAQLILRSDIELDDDETNMLCLVLASRAELNKDSE